MTLTLREIARALGGEISGRSVSAPGPGHSAKDRSLSITLSPLAPNGFLVNSFAGDDPLNCLDYVRARLRLAPFGFGGKRSIRAVRWSKPISKGAASTFPSKPQTKQFGFTPIVRSDRSNAFRPWFALSAMSLPMNPKRFIGQRSRHAER